MEAEESWYHSKPSTEGGQETAILLGEGTSSLETESGVFAGSIGTQAAATGGGDGHTTEREREEGGAQGLLDGIKGQIGQEVAGQLWQAGRQSTQRFMNTYAHIDILRPYFDVEPSEFRDRLVRSFLPSFKTAVPQEVSSDLYGPTMLVFTLVAVLLYGMKSSGLVVEEGTLMGTAMVVCLGYWLGISAVLFFISYLFNAHFSLLQLLSVIGYSLTAHCTILLLSTAADHYGTPTIFYPIWALIGGITAAKMVGIFVSRTWLLRDGLVLSAIAVVGHLLSILYLRFAYHKVYEVVAKVI